MRGYEALDDRVKVLSTEKNSGPGVARNVGLRNARGRYIAFLDSDDLWMKHKLEKQVLSFNNQDAILSCTSTILLNPRGDILGIISGRSKVYLKDMKLANRVTMSSAMIRKNLIGAEIIPRIRSRQDYAYWISLLQNNRGHIAGVQEPLVGYVKMPGSVSSNACKNVIDTFRMYVSEVGLSPLQAAAAVVVLTCLKVRKEFWARMSWFCMPRAARRRLQHEIKEHWRPLQAKQAPQRAPAALKGGGVHAPEA